MTAADYVDFIIQKGFSLEVRGDRLRVSPAKALPRGIIESLTQFKSEIIAALQHRQQSQDQLPQLVSEEKAESVDRLQNCPRCRLTEYDDVAIHGGQSIRRDCLHCHRFIGWPLWYGLSDPELVEAKP